MVKQPGVWYAWYVCWMHRKHKDMLETCWKMWEEPCTFYSSLVAIRKVQYMHEHSRNWEEISCSKYRTLQHRVTRAFYSFDAVYKLEKSEIRQSVYFWLVELSSSCSHSGNTWTETVKLILILELVCTHARMQLCCIHIVTLNLLP